MKPVRIQRTRTKGWRMPENTVYVGRGTLWGNPFTQEAALAAGYHGSRRHMLGWCATRYRDWLDGKEDDFGEEAEKIRQTIIDRLPELRGHDLACWCPLTDELCNPVACHADVLLELANQ